MSLIPRGDNQATPYVPQYWDLLEPFWDMHSLFFPDTFFGSGTTTRTSVDYKETSHAHIIRACLPGMSRDDVEIEVDGDHVVRIIGLGGQFVTSFTLAENARMDLVQANMVDGFLTVAVPKFEEQQQSRDNVRVVEITGDE